MIFLISIYLKFFLFIWNFFTDHFRARRRVNRRIAEWRGLGDDVDSEAGGDLNRVPSLNYTDMQEEEDILEDISMLSASYQERLSRTP